jgi:hypothetical protein
MLAFCVVDVRVMVSMLDSSVVVDHVTVSMLVCSVVDDLVIVSILASRLTITKRPSPPNIT